MNFKSRFLSIFRRRLLSGLVALTVTVTLLGPIAPAAAKCESKCNPAEATWGIPAVLGPLFIWFNDTIMQTMIGQGLTYLYQNYMGKPGAYHVTSAATSEIGVKTQLSDKKAVDLFRQDMAGQLAKIAAEFRPSRSVCVQMSQQMQLRRMDHKLRQNMAAAQVARGQVFSGAAGTVAARGRIAAVANLFTKYKDNYNASSLPTGMTGAAPRGPQANILAAASLFNRDQLPTPAEIDAAQDMTTLIFAGGLTDPQGGDQLALPAARQRAMLSRNDRQAYILAASVFTDKIEALRNPAADGVTVTPGANFTKPASYQSVSAHYYASMDPNVVAPKGASQLGTWQGLSAQLDINSRLLSKIFEESERWAQFEAARLRHDMDEGTSGSMGQMMPAALRAN